LRARQVRQFEREIDLDLAIEAPDPVPQRTLSRLGVLVAAVVTDEDGFHTPTIRPLGATWVARRKGRLADSPVGG
jgi:hypothetical protein